MRILNHEQKNDFVARPNILVVEDNYDDMEYICGMLKTLTPEPVIFKTGKAIKALDMICAKPIDLVLLDVELPDMNGFSLASRVRNMEEHALLPLVFITGTDASPLAAHKRYHCYDYIKKPFAAKTFRQIIEPLIQGLLRQKQTGQAPEQKREKAVLLETKEEIFIVKYQDIFFAEISGRTITVHTRDKKINGIKMRLEDFIQHMDAPDFLRCHKSYAVNTSTIDKMEKIDYRSWSIVFKDDQREKQDKCLVSKTYRDPILRIITNRERDL